MQNKSVKTKKQMQYKTLVIFMFVICISSLFYLLTKGDIVLKKEIKRNGIVVEYGDAISFDIEEYISSKTKNEIINEIHINTTSLSLEEGKNYPAVGTYEIRLEYKKEVKKVKVIVKDTTAPIFKLKEDILFYQGMPLEEQYLVKEVFDLSDYSFSFDLESTMETGIHQVNVVCSDSYGNQSNKTIALTILEDVKKPLFLGLKDRIVPLGSTISYRDGISVIDNSEATLDFEVNTNAVNLEKTGTYNVTYTTIDYAGNKTEQTIKITVSDDANAIVTTAKLQEYLDKITPTIIKSSMSDEEKANAIYTWVRQNISWYNSSNKEDWLIAAYDGFTKKYGDCYTFYAVSRALLEDAGFNIIEIKADTTAFNHWWILMQIEGAWYHYDATPVSTNRDRIVKYTDTQLKNFDSKANDVIHVWDPSSLPSTGH